MDNKQINNKREENKNDCKKVMFKCKSSNKKNIQ